MIVNMIQDLRKRMKAQVKKIQEKFSKDLRRTKEQTDEQDNN